MTRPVLAVPFLAGDLRPLLDSIDIPVRLVVIDNSPTGASWDVVPDDAHVIDLPANIGYTASVNLTVRTHLDEPYWLIANHDVELAPGDLARLVDAAESGEWGWVGINDWAVFALTAECVETVGLWDESAFFNYCSDADYERRCDLSGVRRGFIEGRTTHVGSAVINQHTRYRQANARSYPEEVRAYCDKWDVPGVRHPGGHETPWDSGRPVSYWPSPTLSRLRKLAWR